MTASLSTNADRNSFDGTTSFDADKLFVLLDNSGFGDDRIEILPNDVPFLRRGVLTCDDALKLTSILAIYGNVIQRMDEKMTPIKMQSFVEMRINAKKKK